MDYLKKYNLSEEDIAEFLNVIEERGLTESNFRFNSSKIEEILDIFVELGVRNIFELIITAPEMFYDPISSIKRRINSYPNKTELARLINEDINNLALVNLI